MYGTSSQPKQDRAGERGGRQKPEKKGREKEESLNLLVTIFLLIAPAVSLLQNMNLLCLDHDRNIGDWINTILCSD